MRQAQGCGDPTELQSLQMSFWEGLGLPCCPGIASSFQVCSIFSVSWLSFLCFLFIFYFYTCLSLSSLPTHPPPFNTFLHPHDPIFPQ